MLTRLIVRARLRSALKHRDYILGLIASRNTDMVVLHPENLQRVVIEREIKNLLEPELAHNEELIEKLEARLKNL